MDGIVACAANGPLEAADLERHPQLVLRPGQHRQDRLQARVEQGRGQPRTPRARGHRDLGQRLALAAPQ